MKKIKFCILILVFIPKSIFSLSTSVNNTTLYNVALGGPHTGMVKGFDTFFNNPALLAKYNKEISLVQLNTNLKGDALDIINLYLGGELALSDPSGLLTTLEDNSLTSLLVGLDVIGPISIGRIGNNWGWYVKNTSNVFLDLPGITSSAEIIVREDLTFATGIAIPFKMLFGNSFLLKLFQELCPGLL